MIANILLILSAFLIGGVITASYHILRKLTWGAIRKLDQRYKRSVQIQVEKWFNLQNELRIILRFLSLVALGLSFIGWYKLGIRLGLFYPERVDYLSLIILVLFLCYCYVCVTESISTLLAPLNIWLLRIVIPPVLLFYWLFYLLLIVPIRLHQRMEKLELREQEEEVNPTEEEIKAILEMQEMRKEESVSEEKTSSIEEDKGKMIKGVLNLDETLVREIMTPRVDLEAISVNASIEEVKAKIVETGHSRIPVYRESIDDIIGIIYSKDLLDSSKVDSGLSITEIMHPPVFIPETKSVIKLLQEFKEKKVHIAIVIDEYGGTAGLVSLEDILEEIVGDISDEYDVPEENSVKYQKKDDGSIVVEGRLSLEEVKELLDLELDDDKETVTIGGYITTCLGRIPKTGEEFSLDTMQVKILEADERKIILLQIWKREQSLDDDKGF